MGAAIFLLLAAMMSGASGRGRGGATPTPLPSRSQIRRAAPPTDPCALPLSLADPCPADAAGRECSGHGLCRRGRCLCDPGYAGSSCGPKQEPPPTRTARERMTDDKGRPRYGRAYADQLKRDLASEMDRRRAENEERMRKLRDQFKDQNKQIEQASSGRRPSLPFSLASTRLC